MAVIWWPSLFFCINSNHFKLGLALSGLCCQSDSIGEVVWQHMHVHEGKSCGLGSARKKIIACDALPAISVNG